jgi:hypothetical protein
MKANRGVSCAVHLMGLRHVDLTFRHGGRDLRLTDVHGNVIRDARAHRTDSV